LAAELQKAQQGRETFKDQFMEMREVNKDLKLSFSRLERQVDEFRAVHTDQSRLHTEEERQFGRTGKSRRGPSNDRTLDLSDKENSRGQMMTTVQESMQEDKGYRKRQNMLSEI
jgi:hypothetical protein